MASPRTSASSPEPSHRRKRMAQAGGESNRGLDDLELASKVATIALSSPLIRRLNSEVLRYITRAATVIRCAEGELLAAPNDRSLGLLLVLRGHIGAEVDSPAGPTTLSTLGPGEVCGGELLIPDIPALPRLRAKTPVEVLAIPYGVARILTAREPQVAELLGERHAVLSSTALLRMSPALGSRAPDELLARSRFVTIQARECILAEGAVADSVYLLASGAVEVAVPHPVSGFEDVRRDSPGDLLGRCSALGSPERAATWTTSEACLLRLPRRLVEQQLRSGLVELKTPSPAQGSAREAA